MSALAQGLPAVLGNLTRLKTFKAFNNRIEWIPPELAGLRALQELSFVGNAFELKPEHKGMVLEATSSAGAREVSVVWAMAA